MNSKFEFYIPSSDGVSRIHGIHWKPDGVCRAVVQISHGMVEHIGRYGGLAEYLNNKGIAVIGHDHLGHGKTTAAGRHGIFAPENGAYYVLEDIKLVSDYVNRQYPLAFHVLLGHSMGSFFARRYITIHKETVDAVILMGTGSPSPFILKGGNLLIKNAVKKAGRDAFNETLHDLVLGRYNKPFEPGTTSHDWLSRDVEQAKRYEEDPDCSFLFSNGAYEDFFRIMIDLQQKKQFDRIPKDLPVLILSGDKDPVGDNGKGVLRVYRTLKQTGLSNISMKLYPQARHELINEIGKDDVFIDIEQWIKQQIK